MADIGRFVRRITGRATPMDRIPRSESYGKDIDLPLEAGQRRDRRLPAKPPSLGESLSQAAKGYKLLRERGIVGGRSQSKR